MDKTCTVGGCERGYAARGFCPPHYRRLMEHGDPLAGPPLRTWGRTRLTYGQCVAERCPSRATVCAGGLVESQVCHKHYQRWRKYGDINAEVKGDRRGPVYNANGYIIIKAGRKGSTALEHRLIMAAHLGRDLLPNENVHHINGVRDDTTGSRTSNCGSRGNHEGSAS